jgi:hypothetical protein
MGDTHNTGASPGVLNTIEGQRPPSTTSGSGPSIAEKVIGEKHKDVPQHDIDSIRAAKQTQGEAFALGGDTRFYEPIDSYEGKHRWDPKAEWTPEEEKRVIRKLDWKICTWCCFMFFALQLDRGNISQALSDNFLNDLGLNTNQYNYGQTIFFLSFLCAELPSQMISKKLGPDNWIPIQMVSWSIVAICQCRLTGQSSFYATRALLGLLEGGFIPDVILYLSYFYKSKELPIRLSFFWSAYIGTQVVSSFLAFGILRLRFVTSWEGWRWLFALEGGLTAVIGIVSWFYLPPSPTQTASKFRGEAGWFTEREEIIMVNRILRDDPSKGDMHNRQGLSLKLLGQALFDWDLFPVYLLGLTWTMAHATISAYLTLTLRSLGFDTFQTNLLTIPGSVLLFLQLVFWTWVSERINNRFGIVLVCQIWLLPLLVALSVISNDSSPWARYTILILLMGYPYVHAILVAITSRNAGSVRTRTVGSALYNMSVQASNIIASNVYLDDDKPFYRRGNRVLVAITAWNIVLIIAIKAYYWYKNESRDKRWNAMSEDEKRHYLETTKDEGNKRLDFRFAH